MAKAPAVTGNKGLIWMAWLLSTAGFAILLGGVASMQQACGGGLSTVLTQGGGGTVGYLAPVSCNHLFQYTWWITMFHLFTWFLVGVYMIMNVLHKSRTALVGILAAAAVLLMDTANTFLWYNYLPGLTTTMARRTRTTVAGAAIAAAADLLLILFIGWHDDKTTRKERGEVAYKEREEVHGTAYTTVPVGQTTTTTTTAAGTVPTTV